MLRLNYLYFLLLFIVSTHVLVAQSQMGGTIVGESGSDNSGFSVSLSASGTLVAIGAKLNDGANGVDSGHVRIFKREFVSSTVTWTQLGGDIDGKAAGDLFGNAVSISSNGDKVAVGAPGNGAGYVRVFQYTPSGTSSWTQLGQDIVGETSGDKSGYSVSLSSDGTKVAIGAYLNDGKASNAGHVRVYEFTPSGTSSWTQIGGDIDGAATTDESGLSVSLSSDGTKVAIGSHGNDSNGTDAGHVRVFKNEIISGTSTWTQLGSAIVGSVGDRAGASVSLSSDGTKLAIGAIANDGGGADSGQVRIFEYTPSGTASWTQLGSSINGLHAGDNLGRSVSLSSDGTIVSMGAPLYGAGYVLVYQYSSGSWSQKGATLNGDTSGDRFGYATSMSGNGKNVAIGAYLYDGVGTDGGSAKIYSFNLAPTNISLSSSTIDENKSVGSLVGTLSTTDSDTTDTHTYSLVSGTGSTDNSSFTISGTQLLSNAVFDYETKSSYTIRIQSIDSDFSTYSKTFTIGINDLSEDSDGDGIANSLDVCPNTPAGEAVDSHGCSASQKDSDGDGIKDHLDNCVTISNANQKDFDGDGYGDVCDMDDDDDGWNDTIEIACGSNPLDASSKPLDTDRDGIANCQDSDIDNDGCLNADDALPLDATECRDADGDGIGDIADTDDDNDGQRDADEIQCGSNPLDATSMSPDFDGDGILDCIDKDDDNDGFKDYADAFPYDALEWADYDQDGKGNNADLDDDNDGWSDATEENCGTNPLLVVSQPTDLDKDGIADCEDFDRDGDGILNTEDAFPTNPNEWVDTDGDGVGNNLDADDDNDGCTDTEDAFPLDLSECFDNDGDGIGDHADLDDDNDGFEDLFMGVSSLLTPHSGTLESKWIIANIAFYPNASVHVYSINGMEVFSSIGYQNDWSGTYQSSNDYLPAGTYYYIVNYHKDQMVTKGWLYLTY